jgi:hypothetical protein
VARPAYKTTIFFGRSFFSLLITHTLPPFLPLISHHSQSLTHSPIVNPSFTHSSLIFPHPSPSQVNPNPAMQTIKCVVVGGKSLLVLSLSPCPQHWSLTASLGDAFDLFLCMAQRLHICAATTNVRRFHWQLTCCPSIVPFSS